MLQLCTRQGREITFASLPGIEFRCGTVQAAYTTLLITLEATDCSVNFVLNETASQEARNAYVNELTNGNTTLAQAGKMSTAAGIACVIRANNSTQKTVISNVTVK